MKKILQLIFAAALAAFIAPAAAGEAENNAAAARQCLDKLGSSNYVYQAEGGWLYPRAELEFLAAGPLTPEKFAAVSKAVKKDNANPAPAIIDFKQNLEKLGIKLLVVPVPAKAAVRPLPGMQAGAPNLAAFYETLRAAGVNILDLTPDFTAAGDKALYCRSDAHWAPEGIAIAAEKIAAVLAAEKLGGNTDFAAAPKEVTVAGDLQTLLDKNAAPAEKLTLNQVSGEVFSDKSPVLLLGDSHTLVFSAGGDMLAEKAGLGEQLARRLRMPVERLAVKGSASTAVRISLYRKGLKTPGWLEGKKAVVWCFTVREFTESSGGWVKVPVMKNAPGK